MNIIDMLEDPISKIIIILLIIITTSILLVSLLVLLKPVYDDFRAGRKAAA